MKSVSFSIARVNRLRQAAERARALPDEHSDPSPERRRPGGWFASAYDANDLIGVFDTLWLKSGFTLHAYEFREGGNGNGIIWAVPTDAPLLGLDECRSWIKRAFLHSPRPPGAVPLMQAIEGDGSPWSYLSASILCREAEEFGAIWHGCVWSSQTILSKPPRQADGQDVFSQEQTGDTPVGNWTWQRAAPRTWEPTYIERGTTKKIVLYTHTPVYTETICRATDTYRADSYDHKTRATVLCTGDSGICP